MKPLKSYKKTYAFFDKADGVVLRRVYSDKPLPPSAIRKEIDDIEGRVGVRIGCKEESK